MAELATTKKPDAEIEKKRERVPVVDDSAFANLLDTAKFEHMYRVADIFAHSKLVPQHFQGDTPSCFVACQMSVRLGVDPLMFMQNSYVVGNKPGMEAKFAIGLVNSSGIFKGPLQWKFNGSGKTRSCTCFAAHAKTGELCELTIDWEVVEKEGWTKKQGSKWLTMPDQMFRYRTATWFARAFCPERLLGMNTVDELEDIEPPRKIVENAAPGTAGLLSRLREANGDPEPAPAPSDAAEAGDGHQAGSEARNPSVYEMVDLHVQTVTGIDNAEHRDEMIERWRVAHEIDAEDLKRPSDGSDESNAIIATAKKSKWETYDPRK